MDRELKGNSRSLRYTDTVKKIIEKQPGKGFNEKFENMVLLCEKRLPEIEKEIKEKEKHLKELITKINKTQQLVYECDNLKINLEALVKKSKTLSEKDM